MNNYDIGWGNGYGAGWGDADKHYKREMDALRRRIDELEDTLVNISKYAKHINIEAIPNAYNHTVDPALKVHERTRADAIE